MKITVRTIGNPGLYQSLQDSVASETHHTTVSGAIRRLEKIERDSAEWARCMGLWGKIEIAIGGETLESTDVSFITDAVAQDTRERDMPPTAPRYLQDIVDAMIDERVAA